MIVSQILGMLESRVSTNGFIFKTQMVVWHDFILGMWKPWNPKREKIMWWFRGKLHAFVSKEIRDKN